MTKKSMVKMFPLLLFLFTCARVPTSVVSWEPSRPVWGEDFTIKYHPKSEEAPSTIFLVVKLRFDQFDSSVVEEMKKENKGFFATIQIPKETNALQFKFSDSEGKDDLKDGLGWFVLVEREQGKLAPGALRTMGEILEEGMGWTEGDTDKAMEFYQRASKENPEDPLLKSDLLRLRLALEGKEKLRDEGLLLAEELEKKGEPNSLYASITLYVALEDTQGVERASRKFLSLYPQDKRAAEVELSLSFRNRPRTKDEWKRVVETFFSKYPGHRRRYSMLGSLASFYYEEGNLERALELLRWGDTLSGFDLSYKMGMARILLDMKEVEPAESILDLVRGKITPEALIRANPWASQNRRSDDLREWKLQYLNSRSLVFSYKGEKDSALIARMKMAEFARYDNKFPILLQVATEAESLGDTGVALNALWQAFLGQPENPGLRNRLKELYVASGKSEEEFEKEAESRIGSIVYETAPQFTVVDIRGKKMKLSDLRGKVVVLNFWATWCVPCRREIPALNNLVKNLEGMNVVFLGISHEKKDVVENFLKENDFNYQICVEGGDVFNLYGVTGIPTHVLIDSQGRLRRRHVGFTPDMGQKIEREIRVLLGEVS